MVDALLDPRDLGLPARYGAYRPGQAETILAIASDERSRFHLVSAPTGCIAGDAIVQIARGSGVKLSRGHCMSDAFINQFDKRRKNGIRSHTCSLFPQEGRLGLQPIHGITYSGIRETLTMTLVNGNTLRATPDHQIMTADGWLPMSELRCGTRVICDGGIPKKDKADIAPKRNYRQAQGLVYHPFAGGAQSKTLKPRCLKPEGRLYRVAYHRLVLEAAINNLEVEELIVVCRTDRDRAAALLYLDPTEVAVHHKDGNHLNNCVTNLEALTHAEHARTHDPAEHLQRRPIEVAVKGVKYYGREDTYDISCDGPEPNFTANGIVVHNSGKSLINVSISLLSGMRTLFLVSTKALQDQLSEYASIGLYDIRGHSNYPCARHTYDDHGDLVELECRGGCHHKPRVEEARRRSMVLSNYANWISILRSDEPDKLGTFDLIVCDEAHLTPDLVVAMMAVKLSRRTVAEELGMGLPETRASIPDVWLPWAREALTAARNRYRVLRDHKAPPRDLAIISKLGRDLAILEGVEPSTRWVAEDSRRGVTLSPVWATDYAERFLFADAARVLLTSATLAPSTGKYLGIADTARAYHEIASSFDPARRPLIYIPTTRVDHRMGEGQTRILLNRIDSIIESRLHVKGVVHARSYARAREIVRRSRWSDYLITHGPGEARTAVARFKRAEPPCVLVSPAVEEGVDFPFDECRFQIIVKVPFLDTRGPLIEARVREDKAYSGYMTSQALIQQTGRGMRAASDSCETFLLDDHFAWFRRKGDFPDWFRASWREASTIPATPDFY